MQLKGLEQFLHKKFSKLKSVLVEMLCKSFSLALTLHSKDCY